MPPIVSKDYKENKKKLILQSALECFAQKGFVATTVSDIGKRSGLSKGSIYNYFDSKEAIYFELLNATTERNKTDITSNFAKLRSSISKISFLFDIYLKLAPIEAKQTETIVLFYEFTFHCVRSEKLLDFMRERGNFLLNLIKETIEQGKEAGEIDENIDANLYAHKFWMIIDGVSLQSISRHFHYYDVLREMKEMYLEEIRKK